MFGAWFTAPLAFVVDECDGVMGNKGIFPTSVTHIYHMQAAGTTAHCHTHNVAMAMQCYLAVKHKPWALISAVHCVNCLASEDGMYVPECIQHRCYSIGQMNGRWHGFSSPQQQIMQISDCMICKRCFRVLQTLQCISCEINSTDDTWREICRCCSQAWTCISCHRACPSIGCRFIEIYSINKCVLLVESAHLCVYALPTPLWIALLKFSSTTTKEFWQRISVRWTGLVVNPRSAFSFQLSVC